MTNLEYYLHDEADVLRIEIVGDLSGAGVNSIEHAWRTASSVLAGRHIVVGLTAVAEADDDGRGLLLTLHRFRNRCAMHLFSALFPISRSWRLPKRSASPLPLPRHVSSERARGCDLS